MYKVTTLVCVFLLVSFTGIYAQTSPSIVVDLVEYSQALYYNHAGHIARTSDGKLFAVWTSDAGDSQILFSEYDNAFQIWSPGVALSAAGTGGDAHKAGIASDDAGNLHCVWQQRNTSGEDWAIYYTMYNGTSWSTPANISGNTAENEEASIAVSDQGRVFVAWNTDAESDSAEWVLCTYSDDGVNWSTPDTLSSADGIIGGTSTTSGRPFLAKGVSGKMVCTWHEEPDGHPYRESFVNQFDGSSWGSEIVHIDVPDSANSMYPTIGVDSNENIYLLYVSFTSPEKLLMVKKAWGDAAFPAVPDTIITDDDQLTKPFIGFDANDNMYVVYRGDNIADTTYGLEQINYITSADAGATWSTPAILSRPDHDAGYVTLEPRIGVGGVDVLWRESYSTTTDDGDSLVIVYGHIDLVVNSIGQNNNIVHDFRLDQNFPNPFNPTTTINFKVAEAGKYSLEIFDVLGQKVKTLFSGDLNIGEKTAVWNSLNDNGKSVSSGVYYYKLQGDNVNIIKKMIFMR